MSIYWIISTPGTLLQELSISQLHTLSSYHQRTRYTRGQQIIRGQRGHVGSSGVNRGHLWLTRGSKYHFRSSGTIEINQGYQGSNEVITGQQGALEVIQGQQGEVEVSQGEHGAVDINQGQRRSFRVIMGQKRSLRILVVNREHLYYQESKQVNYRFKGHQRSCKVIRKQQRLSISLFLILTSTFLLYRGLVHHDHRILNQQRLIRVIRGQKRSIRGLRGQPRLFRIDRASLRIKQVKNLVSLLL